MEKLWQYNEASEYLLGIPKFTSKNKPQDTRAFWEFLGCPGGKQKMIHVAGTNGKGSVCSYLNAILQEMGYSVGLFTSPHLVEMTERIQINRKEVTKEEFAEGFSEVLDAVGRAGQTAKLSGYHPTFFEFLFFLSMVLFQRKGTDYIILETGLGGRLDATNCIPEPVMTILTRIGMDHTEYLGDTIEKIAAEKAGIIKPHVPVVALKEPEEAAKVIRHQAALQEAPLCLTGEDDISDLGFRKKCIDFSYRSRYYDYIRLTLSTSAAYQAENAVLALKAAELLFGDKLTAEQMKHALSSAVWEGRMEEILPGVYVDGAHNEDGIRAFLDTVRRMRAGEPEGKFYLLFSVVKEKNHDAMMHAIASEALFDEVALAPLQSSRSLSAESLQALADQNGIHCFLYKSVEDAFLALLSKKQEKDVVFAAGSLYLTGQIKALLRTGANGKGI